MKDLERSRLAGSVLAITALDETALLLSCKNTRDAGLLALELRVGQRTPVTTAKMVMAAAETWQLHTAC